MTTTRLGIPTPTLATTPTDIPADLVAAANQIDAVVVKFKEDTHANRPAAGTHGYLYYETDTGVMFYDNGTVWQVVGASNRIGLYSARPLANAVPAGTSYYATDKDVPYISDGSAWYREDTEPGDLFITLNAAASTGRILLQGQDVSRVGLFDELFAKWGTTYGAGNGTTTFTLPDMRGRVPVDLGTHTDVSTIGNNDGVAVANRRPKHNSSVTNGLTLPDHVHNPAVSDMQGVAASITHTINSGGGSGSPDVGYGSTAVGNPTTHPAIGGSLTVGPGGTTPIDAPAYFVVQFEAKL